MNVCIWLLVLNQLPALIIGQDKISSCMPPAARLGDTHVCPIHGPNTIVTGSPDTFLGGRPAARVGDMTACGAPIVSGSAGVFVNGRPVVRMGDKTAHGGVITTGDVTIEIGDFGMSFPLGPGGVAALLPAMHDRQWAKARHENFRTKPAKKLDPENLTPEELAAYDLLADQGHENRRDEIMDSGRNYEIRRLKKGGKLFGFTTAGHPKKGDSPYWMTEEELKRIESKHCQGGTWGRQAVKDELALPCMNRANALSETTLTQDADVVVMEINPATENTYYTDSVGQITQIFSKMPGGGGQVIPPKAVIGNIATRNL